MKNIPVETMQVLMRELQEKLPDGVDFAILVCIPPEPGTPHGSHGHVQVVSTDRERVAFAAAQWALEILPAEIRLPQPIPRSIN